MPTTRRRDGNPIKTQQRTLVLDWLQRRGGEVVPPDGARYLDPLACLADAGYSHGPQAWVSLLKGAERDGLIARDIRGKRTLAIRLPGFVPTPEPEPEPEPEPDEASREAHPTASDASPVDYDQLARRVLAAAIEAARTPGATAEQLEAIAGERDDARERLRSAVEQANRNLSRRKETEDLLRAARDESVGLRRRIRELEANNSELVKAAQAAPEPPSEATRRFLDQMMRQAPGST